MYNIFNIPFVGNSHEFNKAVLDFLHLQEKILDSARIIANNYTETQKNIINWWSSITEYSMQYYYP